MESQVGLAKLFGDAGKVLADDVVKRLASLGCGLLPCAVLRWRAIETDSLGELLVGGEFFASYFSHADILACGLCVVKRRLQKLYTGG